MSSTHVTLLLYLVHFILSLNFRSRISIGIHLLWGFLRFSFLTNQITFDALPPPYRVNSTGNYFGKIPNDFLVSQLVLCHEKAQECPVVSDVFTPRSLRSQVFDCVVDIRVDCDNKIVAEMFSVQYF